MRPLRLELEGFTAFRRRTCLDLESLDLFAITGPTGAGKSSLIDAVCYALYGRVPRVNTEVSNCISLGLDRMQVTLVFRAHGNDYRVLREARRKGSSTARLEQMGPDGEWQPLADRAREVTDKVTHIVGLDFDAFIRSALLPQGQFQEFLAGSPERRRDVLDKLLRIDIYRRMQARAGQETALKQSRVNELEGRLKGELSEATPATRTQREAELAAAHNASTRLASELIALQEGIALANGLATARQEVSRLKLAKREAETRLSEARGVAEAGDKELERLRIQLASTRAALQANSYDDELLAALTGAANLAASVEGAKQGLTRTRSQAALLEKESATADAAAKKLDHDIVSVRDALEHAEAALHEAQRHDLAAALQAGLQKGDACPVCGGAIGVLPAVAGGGIEAAQQALTIARRQGDAVRSALERAKTAAAVATTKLTTTRQQAELQSTQLTEAARKLDDELPGFEDRSLATIQALLGVQRGERTERERMQREERATRDALEKQEAALAGARLALTTLEAEANAATASATRTQEALTAATAQLEQAASKARWQDVGDALAAGNDPAPYLESRRERCTREQQASLMLAGRLEEQIAKLERDIELAKELRAELASCQGELNIASDLSQMLQANRFQAYVQSQALRTLAEDGSRKLLELSGERYELVVADAGQDFEVRDRWNADESRSVRTLSGGETFLASLSLALALAETLPGLAPGRRISLDSIFLDEGFGSLDPEALDRAADALDALRINDRFVCVVTHLKELAERLPARVMVHKAEEGSTIAIA